MQGIRLNDRKTDKWIRSNTKVLDAREYLAEPKNKRMWNKTQQYRTRERGWDAEKEE